MRDGDKSRILLIDDDKSLTITLRDFLCFEGYEVMTAASGEEGLERLEEFSPDLIILDMMMPGMGGMGFLERVSKDGSPEYPVLVLTAKAQMAEFFGNINVDGFVAKPCDPNDLLMEVGRIIFLTRGKVMEARDANGAQSGPSVLLGESDVLKSETFREVLTHAGCLVHPVARGPEVLEKAILARPDVIVLSIELAAAEDGAVSRMLSEMPNTRLLPLVVYDVDDPAELPAGVADRSGVRCVAGHAVPDIRAAIEELLIN
ncbi:MAG: response regulator [Kiritimatiellae bacterium]|nr:response regulator [Kiritimatiellia bacterium]